MNIKEEIQITEKKNYRCQCGVSYERNSSLFNHIKMKHDNNKQYYLSSQSRVGRPKGQRAPVPKQKTITKVLTKQIKCKCGSFLSGEGAFQNHVRYIHKNDPSFKLEKKQQGRKKKIQNEPLIDFDSYNQYEQTHSFTLAATQSISTIFSESQTFTENIYVENFQEIEETSYGLNYQVTQPYEHDYQNTKEEAVYQQQTCNYVQLIQLEFNENHYYDYQYSQPKQEEEDFLFF